MTFERALKISIVLGAMALVGLVVAHLALTDIYHAEGDLRAEWAALRASIAVVALFVVVALATLWRALVRPLR